MDISSCCCCCCALASSTGWPGATPAPPKPPSACPARIAWTCNWCMDSCCRAATDCAFSSSCRRAWACCCAARYARCWDKYIMSGLATTVCVATPLGVAMPAARFACASKAPSCCAARVWTAKVWAAPAPAPALAAAALGGEARRRLPARGAASPSAPCFPPSSPASFSPAGARGPTVRCGGMSTDPYLRSSVEFQWFLTALSVRPESFLAMDAHLLP
mmetsp:Transcript_2794/g.11205  ORF Transcript_2794/g.11205 Transcript_2794/m.11205 type:complete len:218 (-) Transcript_2794:302-955(-)